jgi:Spy/CpxP family protein refolding chaperone
MPDDETTDAYSDQLRKVSEMAAAGDVDSAEYRAEKAKLEALQREMGTDDIDID